MIKVPNAVQDALFGERMQGGLTRVRKPWGFEIIFAQNDEYIGKIMKVNAGETMSLQYHREKDETAYVMHGTLGFEFRAFDDNFRQEWKLESGSKISIPSCVIHRMFAPDGDVVIVEVSSPEGDDIVRLEDKYGRCDGIARRMPILSWLEKGE